MNCDEAFELMTHPADYNCDELQWHLQMCPRCRQMQETLAPALTSFQKISDGNDLSEEELALFDAHFTHQGDSQNDTGFTSGGKPFLSPEAVRIAEQAATRLSAEVGLSQPSTEVSPAIIQRKRMLQAALVLFVGFVLGWGISMDVPSENMPVGAAASLPAQEPCLWIAQRDQNISSEQQQKSTRSTKASAHSVVLSCVACHLQSSAD